MKRPRTAPLAIGDREEPPGTRKKTAARTPRAQGVAPSAAIAAAGTGLLGGEASAAVPPALIDATARAAAAVATGASLAGLVPARCRPWFEGGGLDDRHQAEAGCRHPLAMVASTVLVGFVLDRAAAQKADVAPVIAIAIPSRHQTKGAAEPTNLAAKLSAAGTVVDEAGRPIAGTRVILREWSEYRVRGMASKELEKLPRGKEEIRDTLMETTTDDAGRFRFHEVPARPFRNSQTSQSIFPWDVVALKDGHALAWTQLTPHRERTPITMTLGPEGILPRAGCRARGQTRGRGEGQSPWHRPGLGKGGAGRRDDPGRTSSIFTGRRFRSRRQPTPAAGSTSEAYHAIGMVTLSVTESRHERIFAYAATSDQSQPDLVSKLPPAAGSAEVREPVHTGAFTLTTKLAEHVLTGRVVFESDGSPLPEPGFG